MNTVVEQGFEFNATTWSCHKDGFDIKVRRGSMPCWEFEIRGPNNYYIVGEASSQYFAMQRAAEFVRLVDELPYK